jgi:UDPglucose--hexose-1-phosphate uridylyltransferase
MSIPPHRRRNPLTGEHVLVSPGRTQRPWQGKLEAVADEIRPAYDPTCYLCPGNTRASGQVNPAYDSTFAFDNDFAALRPLAAEAAEIAEVAEIERPDALFWTEPEPGGCRVVCFSPRHDLSLPELSVAEIEAVIATWTDETQILSLRQDIGYVQVFENKGQMMGCSNPHPHSQIWATAHIPNEPHKELRQQKDYWQRRGAPLLDDYLTEELRRQERLVEVNEHWVAVVPFWAVWPFETLVVPRRPREPRQPLRTLLDLTGEDRAALADLLKRLTTRYDNLFEISFPYSMGFHQAPFDDTPHPEWTLHMHFYPPLLRSATVRKFMVGFEMLGTPGRDITPEAAAQRLAEMSAIHYKARR